MHLSLNTATKSNKDTHTTHGTCFYYMRLLLLVWFMFRGFVFCCYFFYIFYQRLDWQATSSQDTRWPLLSCCRQIVMAATPAPTKVSRYTKCSAEDGAADCLWNGLQFNYPGQGRPRLAFRLAGSLKPNRKQRKRSAHKASATNQLNLYPKDTKYSMHCILDVPAQPNRLYISLLFVGALPQLQLLHLLPLLFLFYFVYFCRVARGAAGRAKYVATSRRYTQYEFQENRVRSTSVYYWRQLAVGVVCGTGFLCCLPNTGNACNVLPLRLTGCLPASLLVTQCVASILLVSVAVRRLENNGRLCLARFWNSKWKYESDERD